MLRYQGSPVETQKQVVAEDVIKGKKLLFNEENRAQPSDEVSQKNMVVATGDEDLPDRDLTNKEWCMQYVDSKKNCVVYCKEEG